MIRAYNEMYLEGAMLRLGDMLEYACLDCGYDPDAFWKMFIHSGVAQKFAIGDISIIAGRSGVELAYLVLEQEEKQTQFITPAWREDRSDIFWCGWILAYYQWYTAQSFEQIWQAISMRVLRKMYVTLHEADVTKAVGVLLKMQQQKKCKPSLAMLRISRGLTQKELAARAQMSVSQLQRLEYGERALENVSLKTAMALAKALQLSVEELYA